jgi:hypothetical protein
MKKIPTMTTVKFNIYDGLLKEMEQRAKEFGLEVPGSAFLVACQLFIEQVKTHPDLLAIWERSRAEYSFAKPQPPAPRVEKTGERQVRLLT